MSGQSSIYHIILSVVRRRWIQFLLPFVLILVSSIAVAMFWPATYRSTATILVESQQIPGNLVRATVTTRADERIQIIEQRIRARDNLLKIMRKYSLFEDRRARSNWLQSDVIELMRDRIEIERLELAGSRSRRNKPTIAFKVSFEYEQPVMAARVANELVTYILSQDISTRRSRAAGTTKFLALEKKRLQQTLSAIEGQISEFKGKHKNSLPASLQFNLSMLERAQQRSRAIERDISKILMQKKLMKTLLLSGNIGVANIDGAPAPANVNLRTQLQQLKIELIGKEITFSDSHPEIRRLRKQVAALESRLEIISQETGSESTKKGNPGSSGEDTVKQILLKARLDDLHSQQTELSKNVERLQSYVDRTPQVELSLNSLIREYENLKSELRVITSKKSDAALGEKLEENKQGERFEVIEQATVPKDPDKPNRLMILALGVLAAFGVGGGVVVLLEAFDSNIRFSRDLIQQFNIVPIVAIPYINSQHEVNRTILKRSVAFGGALASIAIGLFLIDQYYLPLSLLADKALKLVFIRMG